MNDYNITYNTSRWITFPNKMGQAPNCLLFGHDLLALIQDMWLSLFYAKLSKGLIKLFFTCQIGPVQQRMSL